MPGFFVSNMQGNKIDLLDSNVVNSKLFYDTLQSEEFTVMRASLDNFRNDKVMIENEAMIIITEGIICNLSELLDKYKAKDLVELIMQLSSEKEDFFKEFRGAFSGGVFDKKEKKWTFYTDHLGSHSVYYYYKDNNFIVASQLNYITDFLKLNNIEIEEDLHGIHCILDWGYLIDNATAVSGIKRLYPGEYVTINTDEINATTYYIANYPPKNYSIEEYIERLDKAFSNAVRRIVGKCIENGYKTVLDMSGGLDSRLTAFRAVELFGVRDLVAFHFSQYDSIEWKVALKVIKELNIEAYCYPMDTSKFLTEFKEVMTLNNGSSYYIGLQAGLSLGKFIDCREYGIKITGAMGDVRDSSMIVEKGDIPPTLDGEYYKTNTLNELNEYSNYSTVIERFQTNEVFWLYLRGILAGMNTTTASQAFIESMTPYGDVEFLEAYLSIPWKIRVDNKILIKWMKKKFPKAAEIKYSQTNLPAKYTGTFFQKNYNRVVAYILKFLIPKNMLDLKTWMNRPEIKNITEQYYKERINTIRNDSIREKIELLYNNGSPLEKSVALSVLAIYDVYF